MPIKTGTAAFGRREKVRLGQRPRPAGWQPALPKKETLRFARRLTSEDDVFFCPGVDLLAMRAGHFAALDFGSGPQLFFDCLPTRRQLRS